MTKHYYNWAGLDRRYFVSNHVLGFIGYDGLAYHYFLQELEDYTDSNKPLPTTREQWDIYLPGALKVLLKHRVATPPVEEKPSGMADLGRWRLISEETPDKPPPAGILGIELWWDDGTTIGAAYTIRWNTAAWYGHPQGGFKRRNTSISEALREPFTHWRYFVPPSYKAPTSDA